jgi:hypothetical protein
MDWKSTEHETSLRIGAAGDFSLRMIVSESRLPLFGIMLRHRHSTAQCRERRFAFAPVRRGLNLNLPALAPTIPAATKLNCKRLN